MGKTRDQDFIRGTGREQARVVNAAAAGVLGVAAAALVCALWVYPHVHRPDGLPLSVDVPYVGPGVADGTKVILHGAEVGEVTKLVETSPGTVRMDLRLRADDVGGLTNSFDLDYRPENYFGVTAVNLIANPGGSPLVSGSTVSKTPTGDFTMSTMLERGSLAVDGSLTQSMIASLDKVIHYTDGLTPLIQSGILVADHVADTQQALPAELLRETNDILAVLPGFDSRTIDALYAIYDGKYNRRADGSTGVDDAFMDKTDAGLGLAANSLFGKAGQLLKSHGTQLTPDAALVQALIGALPDVLDNGALPDTLSTLIDRYNAALRGPDGRRTLNLRLVLDDLPMIAAPVALMVPAPGGHR